MRKGSHQSEESKKKLSNSQKERLRLNPFTDEYKQKQSEVQKERYRLHPKDPVSEETRQKQSKARKQYYELHPLTEEDKTNATNLFKKGNNNWLCKHHTEKTKKILSVKTHNAMLGNTHTLGHHLTEEHKKKISDGCKGKNTGKRPPFSEEWRRKLGDVSRGKIRVFTPEHKQNIAIAHFELWTRQRVSKPQKELFLFLKQIFPDAILELPIKTNRTYRFADIGIPSLKIDFEYDGGYWHKEEARLLKDKARDMELAEVGWYTFRISDETLKILAKISVSKDELKKIIGDF